MERLNHCQSAPSPRPGAVMRRQFIIIGGRKAGEAIARHPATVSGDCHPWARPDEKVGTRTLLDAEHALMPHASDAVENVAAASPHGKG